MTNLSPEKWFFIEIERPARPELFPDVKGSCPVFFCGGLWFFQTSNSGCIQSRISPKSGPGSKKFGLSFLIYFRHLMFSEFRVPLSMPSAAFVACSLNTVCRSPTHFGNTRNRVNCTLRSIFSERKTRNYQINFQNGCAGSVGEIPEGKKPKSENIMIYYSRSQPEEFGAKNGQTAENVLMRKWKFAFKFCFSLINLHFYIVLQLKDPNNLFTLHSRGMCFAVQTVQEILNKSSNVYIPEIFLYDPDKKVLANKQILLDYQV